MVARKKARKPAAWARCNAPETDQARGGLPPPPRQRRSANGGNARGAPAAPAQRSVPEQGAGAGQTGCTRVGVPRVSALWSSRGGTRPEIHKALVQRSSQSSQKEVSCKKSNSEGSYKTSVIAGARSTPGLPRSPPLATMAGHSEAALRSLTPAQLRLEWIYGYKGSGCRNNVVYNDRGAMPGNKPPCLNSPGTAPV